MIQLMIIDRKGDGTIKLDSGLLDMTNRVLPGNPVVPVGLKVPIDQLAPGAYAVVLKASDSAGNASKVAAISMRVPKWLSETANPPSNQVQLRQKAGPINQVLL